MNLRRTKIIVTLGPATDNPQALQRLFEAGVNLVRLNLSHGSREEHEMRLSAVRQCAKTLSLEIGILVDLQGPKIRITQFQEDHVFLEPGQWFTLDADFSQKGDKTIVGIDYKDLPKEVQMGETLLLSEGLIRMVVKDVVDSKIHCQVEVGGKLSNHKGVNRQGGGLTAHTLTQKDYQDIQWASEKEVDYVAVSFPHSAEDIIRVRQLLESLESDAGVIAKIECQDAITHLEDIIVHSDAVMVARGDLGIEVDYAEVPAMQKQIIAKAHAYNKAVITATQMMESMVNQPIPTRAEVSDVANAVLDGTDAVMLSSETAMGLYPVETVEAMAHICLTAESQPLARVSHHRLESQFQNIDEAIAMAAMYTANHLDVKAIVAVADSEAVVRWMSRIRSGIPIFGVSQNKRARARMTLYRGVYPVQCVTPSLLTRDAVQAAVSLLVEQGKVQSGDRVLVTDGDKTEDTTTTNRMTMMIVP